MEIIGDITDTIDNVTDSNTLIRNLSWLNAGLGLANLGVTVAGFALMFTKLNSISD